MNSTCCHRIVAIWLILLPGKLDLFGLGNGRRLFDRLFVQNAFLDDRILQQLLNDVRVTRLDEVAIVFQNQFHLPVTDCTYLKERLKDK